MLCYFFLGSNFATAVETSTSLTQEIKIKEWEPWQQFLWIMLPLFPFDIVNIFIPAEASYYPLKCS